MGVNAFEIKKLEEIISNYSPLSVIELGAQNNYTTSEIDKPPFMSEWFQERDIHYSCIDLAGDNNAYQWNLSKEITYSSNFYLVTDFGTSEHVVNISKFISVAFHQGYINSVYPEKKPLQKEVHLGYYNCWLNKHNLCKVGGIIFSVNPMSGHWPLHGYSYLGEDFYKIFCEIAGYELIEDGIHCATGNCDTGKNIYGIIKRVSDKFPSFDEFYDKLPIYEN